MSNVTPEEKEQSQRIRIKCLWILRSGIPTKLNMQRWEERNFYPKLRIVAEKMEKVDGPKRRGRPKKEKEYKNLNLNAIESAVDSLLILLEEYLTPLTEDAYFVQRQPKHGNFSRAY